MRKSNFAGIAIFLSFTAAASIAVFSDEAHRATEKIQLNVAEISNKLSFQSSQAGLNNKTISVPASKVATGGSHCHSSYIFHPIANAEILFAETSKPLNIAGVCNELLNPQWESMAHNSHAAYETSYEKITYDSHFYASRYAAAPVQQNQSETSSAVPEPASLALMALGILGLLLQQQPGKKFKWTIRNRF